MEQNNNNGLIYFVLGVLIVAVFGLGYLYMAQDPALDTNVSIVEPAANDDDGERSDFNVRVDEDGFTASAESEDNNAN